MKCRSKMSLIAFFICTFLYIIYAVCLFWFHPFVASAKEPVPGGNGNTVVVKCRDIGDGINDVNYDITMKAKEDEEILAFLVFNGSDTATIFFTSSGRSSGFIRKENLVDYVGVLTVYDLNSGNLKSTDALTMDNIRAYFPYMKPDDAVSFQVSGCKVFDSSESLREYVNTGSLDGMLKDPELDKSWYLKDIGYKVTANDSPSSEAGENATSITFSWSTDNLQEGDLLEIKTHNYLQKIGGDRISGFHDYITKDNHTPAFSNTVRASYTLGQYDAAKAWFKVLDNKPLFFKSYDTDIYYLRPYRNGKVGAWCKVTMKRATPTGSPYIESITIGDIDDDGNWIPDDDATEENGGDHGIDQGGNIIYPDQNNPFEGTNLSGLFKYFFDFFKSIPSLLGDLPSLVNLIIGFLPSSVIGFIALGIVVVIILRIVGR